MADPAPNALTAALDFEDRGRKFYLQTAERVTDPLSRKLFQTLAEDELHHQEKIREIFSRLQTGAAWPEAAFAPHARLEEQIRGFFQAHRDTLKPTVTNLAGYEFAMSLERTGIELYTKFARETGVVPEKEFFEALLVEERGHLEALRNVHFFLTQPGDWLQEDESRHWSWMNL